MTRSRIISLIIEAIASFATICAVVVAIWGDWIRAFLAPSKLRIEEHNFRGSLTTRNNGVHVIYYNVIVKNYRSWISAKNCQVLLKQLFRRGPDGIYYSVQLPVPLQFVWSPQGYVPAVTNIHKDQVLDIGFIDENSDKFKPALYLYTNNFEGYVGKNEAVRYCLELVGDNCTSSQPVIIEVAWDGKWSDNMDEMSKHLVVKFARES